MGRIKQFTHEDINNSDIKGLKDVKLVKGQTAVTIGLMQNRCLDYNLNDSTDSTNVYNVFLKTNEIDEEKIKNLSSIADVKSYLSNDLQIIFDLFEDPQHFSFALDSSKNYYYSGSGSIKSKLANVTSDKIVYDLILENSFLTALSNGNFKSQLLIMDKINDLIAFIINNSDWLLKGSAGNEDYKTIFKRIVENNKSVGVYKYFEEIYKVDNNNNPEMDMVYKTVNNKKIIKYISVKIISDKSNASNTKTVVYWLDETDFINKIKNNVLFLFEINQNKEYSPKEFNTDIVEPYFETLFGIKKWKYSREKKVVRNDDKTDIFRLYSLYDLSSISAISEEKFKTLINLYYKRKYKSSDYEIANLTKTKNQYLTDEQMKKLHTFVIYPDYKSLTIKDNFDSSSSISDFQDKYKNEINPSSSFELFNSFKDLLDVDNNISSNIFMMDYSLFGYINPSSFSVSNDKLLSQFKFLVANTALSKKEDGFLASTSVKSDTTVLKAIYIILKYVLLGINMPSATATDIYTNSEIIYFDNENNLPIEVVSYENKKNRKFIYKIQVIKE